MSEHGKTNHWTDLASELGATPPMREKHEDKQPTAQEPLAPESDASVDSPTEADKPSHCRRQPPIQRPSTDWSRLANDLGIASEPEPSSSVSAGRSDDLDAAPGAVADDVGAPSAESREPPVEPELLLPEPPSPPAGLAETASVLTAGGIMFTEALSEADLEFVDEAEEPGQPTEVPSEVPLADEAASETDPKKTGKRRRKRRRRPRTSSGADPDRPDAEAAEAESGEPAAEPPESNVAAAADAAELERPARGKRRRRRRGAGQKKREGDAAEAEDADRTGPPHAEPGDSPDPDGQSALTTPSGGGQRGADRGGRLAAEDAEGKASHRGIPRWEEAVGVVISANLEARAKRPSSKPPRSRGGRSHGGRGKSSEKKS